MPEFNLKNVDALLKWLAGGFAMLAAIAAFFGIRDGSLAFVVRSAPVTVLATFLFVGLGVLLSLLVPAVNKTGFSVLWLSILLLTALFATLLLAPNIENGGDNESASGLKGFLLNIVDKVPFVEQEDLPALGVWTLCALATVLVLLRFPQIRGHHFPWGVTLLILAVISLSCGLYLVAKLSVLETSSVRDVSVVASLETTAGVPSVDISASGSQVPGPVLVRVVGLRTQGGEGGDPPSDSGLLGEQILTPDRSGALAANMTVPIGEYGWNSVNVYTCALYVWKCASASTLPDSTEFKSQASFDLAAQVHRLGADALVTEDGKRVAFSVSGSGFAQSEYVIASVGPAGEVPAATARIVAKSDGQVSWAGTAAIGDSPATWQVMADICTSTGSLDMPDQCSAKSIELASIALQ